MLPAIALSRAVRVVDAANAIAGLTGLMDRANREVKRQLRRTAKNVIRDTPVKKGRLKNNWYASNRAIGIRTNKQNDPSGKKSLARVDKALARLKKGQRFYFFNNLPYARVVEYGLYPNPPKKGTGKTINGFSKKAPQGMLRKNMNGFARAMMLARVK
jgi:hypothetical protein